MNVKMLSVRKVVVSVVAFGFITTASVFAQTVKMNGAITGYNPVQGSIVQKKIAGSAMGSECGQFLRENQLKQGINFQGEPGEKTLAIGVAPVPFDINHPDYVEGRYTAFREAWLVATSDMARALETQLKTSAIRDLQTGQNNANDISAVQRAALLRNQAEQIVISDGNGQSDLGSAFSNGTRLLNAYLADELKKRGHDVEAEQKARNESNVVKKRELEKKAAEAEAELKSISGSRSFQEILEAAALERMKGIYSIFTNENLDADGGKTQMCVLLQYSRRSEKLADMMASRDFSDIPQLEPDLPLLKQLPDPSSPQGVFELITKWGLTVLFDENGQVNLVAYGQAGFNNGDEISELAAKEEAKLRAEGLIRLFINQIVSVQQSNKTSQDVKSFIDGMNKTKLTKETRSRFEQVGDFRPINGMKQILDWSGIHPVTNGGISGSVVAWNAHEAAGALSAQKRQNEVVKDSGGVVPSDKKDLKTDNQQLKSRNGGLSGKTRSRDF